MIRLSEAMARVLRYMSRGEKPTSGLWNRSEWGGFNGTWSALLRRELVTKGGEPELTEKGKEALAHYDRKDKKK